MTQHYVVYSYNDGGPYITIRERRRLWRDKVICEGRLLEDIGFKTERGAFITGHLILHRTPPNRCEENIDRGKELQVTHNRLVLYVRHWSPVEKSLKTAISTCTLPTCTITGGTTIYDEVGDMLCVINSHACGDSELTSPNGMMVVNVRRDLFNYIDLTPKHFETSALTLLKHKTTSPIADGSPGDCCHHYMREDDATNRFWRLVDIAGEELQVTVTDHPKNKMHSLVDDHPYFK